jgi:hypothetical protein
MLIMYEGEYSGAFKAWRHYVPLRKDHGNMAEVVEFLRDPVESAKMIALAYAEICENEAYSYREFIGNFDRIVLDQVTPQRRSSVPTFSREQMDAVSKFYFIQYPYSLSLSVAKRLSRNPIELLRQLVAPKPGQMGFKDVIRRLGRLG